MDYLSSVGYKAIVCRSFNEAVKAIIEYREGKI
jgi:hypothetical protein